MLLNLGQISVQLLLLRTSFSEFSLFFSRVLECFRRVSGVVPVGYQLRPLAFRRGSGHTGGSSSAAQEEAPRGARAPWVVSSVLCLILGMAPRGRKRKGVAQESEAQNVVENDGVARGRRGRPTGGAAQNVNAEVEKITQRVNDIELVVARFQNLHPPIFCGSEGYEKTESWLRAMNNLFDIVEYDSNRKVKLVVLQLRDSAERWWESTSSTLRDAGTVITWDIFCTQFRQEYSPPSYCNDPKIQTYTNCMQI